MGIVYSELSKAKYKQVEDLDCSRDCLTAKLEVAFTLESLCVRAGSMVKSSPTHHHCTHTKAKGEEGAVIN